MHLYIVPGAPTLFYQQGNHNSCIISSLAPPLHYIGDGYALEYIIRRKQMSLMAIQNKGQMHFCRDILLGHHKEKNEKRLNYCIEEWYTSKPYDILWGPYTYPTVCFSLDMCHRTDHCIEVRDKCIFDYNFEVAFPLTQNCLNIKCRGNDTDDIIFVGVSHAIRKVSPEVFQRILNMK